MSWTTLDDLDLAGKTVLTRVDLNVPVEGGRVTDATRIERVTPTVRDILAKGGQPVLLAHFGRPKGKVVEMRTSDGRDVIDRLSEKYTGNPVYQGMSPGMVRVTVIVEPTRIASW